MRLEYRLLDEGNSYPVLYFYDNIEEGEIALRFACDYFIKDNMTFEKTSNSVELEGYVVYVQKKEEPSCSDDNSNFTLDAGIWVELREYRQGVSGYPLVHTFKFTDYLTALLHLQSDFIYFMGREWQKSSAEIDEDRRVYVIYAQPTS